MKLPLTLMTALMRRRKLAQALVTTSPVMAVHSFLMEDGAPEGRNTAVWLGKGPGCMPAQEV